MLFRKAFSITLITQAFVFIIGILNTILIVRAIGAQGRGVYSILLTSVSILSVLSSGGIIWSNTYWVCKERENIRYILSNGLYQAILVLLILLFFSSIFPERILGVVFEGISRKLIFFSMGLVFLELEILHLNSILLGLQDFGRYNLLSVGRLVFFTILNLLFLYGLKTNVEGVVYSWIISAGITFGIGLVGLMRKFQIYHFQANLEQFLKSLKMGGRALSANILGLLLLRSDLFLINWYLGLKEVGYYSVGVAVAELILRVPGIAGNVLFPEVVSNDSLQSVNLVTKITRLMGIPLILCMFVLIFYGKSVLFLAFGKEFIVAYGSMLWILFGIIALSYHVILDNYFAGKGYPAITVWAPALTFVMNVGLNLLLIPRLGISGAAISTCVSYVSLTMIKLSAFSKRNDVSLRKFFILDKQDLIGMKAVFSPGWVKL